MSYSSFARSTDVTARVVRVVVVAVWIMWLM